MTNDPANHRRFVLFPFASPCERVASNARLKTPRHPPPTAEWYTPDVVVKVEVEDATQCLSVEFFDDHRLVLYHGECRQMRIWLSNVGTQAIFG